MNDESKLKKATFGTGLLKGLGITMRHMVSHAVTVQYPDEISALPARSRGVIALKEENCTMCMLCARECPDWCIYIEGHKERTEPKGEGKRAKAHNVLDRFAIDYALCMYCGICVEVCPFDALFWAPDFEYAEYDITKLTHEKERLEDWTYKVLPPPALEEGAEPPEEGAVAPASSAAGPQSARVVGPAPTPVAAAPAEPAPGASPQAAAAGVAAPDASAGSTAEAPVAPARPKPPEVEPDQETFDRVLAEELGRGTDRRVAEGKARRAAMLEARKKQAGGS